MTTTDRLKSRASELIAQLTREARRAVPMRQLEQRY